ncbi:MAG: FKBP-type peptidyl-prolyl cis-trans isomerase [Paludibacter sp.]
MRIFFPHTLGYGEDGSGTIPPYSMLYFDIELLEASY